VRFPQFTERPLVGYLRFCSVQYIFTRWSDPRPTLNIAGTTSLLPAVGRVNCSLPKCSASLDPQVGMTQHFAARGRVPKSDR
jgi:hypothetical protein